MKRNHKITELYGVNAKDSSVDWQKIADTQHCPFSNKKCFKVRKSSPDETIGTCVVHHSGNEMIVCPDRLLHQQKIFVDCLHLLTKHQPGQDLHLIAEVPVPGGNVDFILASAKNGKVVDFVGIELQALDTTGTFWPDRQLFLNSKGVNVPTIPKKSSGINWKMTSKTILSQFKHKVPTFENLNRHLVLVVQDVLVEYLDRNYQTDHFATPADLTDTVHFHAYGYGDFSDGTTPPLKLVKRMSTDLAGAELMLSMRSDFAVVETKMLEELTSKIGPRTRFIPMGLTV